MVTVTMVMYSRLQNKLLIKYSTNNTLIIMIYRLSSDDDNFIRCILCTCVYTSFITYLGWLLIAYTAGCRIKNCFGLIPRVGLTNEKRNAL